MLSESDKQRIRSAWSYRAALVASRVIFGGLALIASLAVIAAQYNVRQSGVVVLVALVTVPPVVVAAIVLGIAMINVNMLRFNLRGRTLFDTRATRQFVAMFVTDLWHLSRRVR